MENIVLKKKVGKFQFVKGQNILWSRRKNIKRAGVILYFYDKEEVYFILGLDKNHKEWTDFGGSVDDNENGGQTAFRELKEETLGVFDELLGLEYKKWMSDEHTVGIIEKTMVILFFQLPINKEEFLSYQQKYEEEVVKRSNVVENTKIKAFSAEEFQAMVTVGNPPFTVTTTAATTATTATIVTDANPDKEETFPMYKLVSHHLSKKIFDLMHWAYPNIYSPKPPTTKITIKPEGGKEI